jgi:16S rRNA (cytosine1402-N4)-methyltransferase
MSLAHLPVLLDAVLDGLNPHPGASLLDGTLGAGGHALGWLERTAPDGRLLGFDRDPSALEMARERLAPYANRVTLVHASYASMSQTAARQGFAPLDAILLDLGFSSLQVDDPARGFSFLRDGPLDMRYDPTRGPTAADLVNSLPESDLADLIYRYGEDRHARRIARAILRARPLHTTTRLAAVIAAAVPRSTEKTHPATRAFQALRIAVNGELDELESALPQTLDLLRPGGRLAVISFHSLEDRIVKTFLKRESTACLCPPRQPVCTCGHVAALTIITRKPITAAAHEIAANPRARSARLRIAERL